MSNNINQLQVHSAENYSHFMAGSLGEWSEKKLEIPSIGLISGKQFIKDIVNSTGCEISINAMPVGGTVPFYHAHKENEEVYIFLGGSGEMRVDDKVFAVEDGSIVRIAPNGMRCWRNTGTTPLTAIIIQVREGSLRQHTFDDGIRSDKPVVW